MMPPQPASSVDTGLPLWDAWPTVMPERSPAQCRSDPARRPAQRGGAVPVHPLQRRLLELHRAAGNRAVGRMLESRASGKLPPQLAGDKQVPVTGFWSDLGGALAFAAGGAPPSTASGKPKAAKPAKLKKRTETRAKGGDCGEFSWVVQWELDRPSPAGGWVVQRVDVTRSVEDCAGNAVTTGGLNTAWYPLWEAWQINPGQKVSTYAELNNDREDDTYGSDEIPGTKGTMTVTGSAEFYEGLTLPASFTVTNAAPTWILPATNTAPTLTGGTGTIPHSLTATWDCCRKKGANKKTKVKTT